MELDRCVVLVTGAARRVGRAIAVRLARAGGQIAVHFKTSAGEAAETLKLCRAAGVEAELFQADFENPDAAAELPRQVIERFGRLDVLINNASVFERMELDGFDVAEWERTLRVNLTAPLIVTHAARDALRAAGGRVINLCDAATARPWPEHLAYIVSKGGLVTLTQALARALAPEINVVGIAPGVAAWPESYGPQIRERLTARIPLRRAGSCEDIAAVVEFVLAEGDYITGSIITVDGGRHIV